METKGGTVGLSSLMGDLDDWCGTPVPGRPPRPPWLREIMTAVIVAELAGSLDDSDVSRELYQVAARMYEDAAKKVALNPQPLPPLEQSKGGRTRRASDRRTP